VVPESIVADHTMSIAKDGRGRREESGGKRDTLGQLCGMYRYMVNGYSTRGKEAKKEDIMLRVVCIKAGIKRNRSSTSLCIFLRLSVI